MKERREKDAEARMKKKKSFCDVGDRVDGILKNNT